MPKKPVVEKQPTNEETIRALRATLASLERGESATVSSLENAPEESSLNAPGNEQSGSCSEDDKQTKCGRRPKAGERSEAGKRAKGDKSKSGDDKPKDAAAARESALRLLNTRLRSSAELERALLKRDFPIDVVQEVIRRYLEVGLLNDATFAREFTFYSLRKMRSRSVIVSELLKRGVAQEHIDLALGEIEPQSELDTAYEYATKRSRTLRGLTYSKAYQRLSGALARRGFSRQITTEVTRKILSDLEMLDDDSK